MKKIDVILPIENTKIIDKKTVRKAIFKWLNPFFPTVISISLTDVSLVVTVYRMPEDVSKATIDDTKNITLSALDLRKEDLKELGITLLDTKKVIATLSWEDEYKNKQEEVDSIREEIISSIEEILDKHPGFFLRGSINDYGTGSIMITNNDNSSDILFIDENEITLS